MKIPIRCPKELSELWLIVGIITLKILSKGLDTVIQIESKEYFKGLGGNYEIVLADPPWPHYGDPNKNGAAGKEYALMTYDELVKFPIKRIMAKSSALFCWMTCPRLQMCMEIVSNWRLYYRGVAYVWVKTRKDGKIISGQGVPPTFTKPTVELLTAWTTNRMGRPFPILTFNQGQVVLAPRTGKHSEKPSVFRKNIVKLCGPRKRVELFARKKTPGWDSVGYDIDGKDISDSIDLLAQKNTM